MEGAGIFESGALGAGVVLSDEFGVWGIFCNFYRMLRTRAGVSREMQPLLKLFQRIFRGDFYQEEERNLG